MDEVGAELADRILPDVPYRQWVLSVPWELRALCARRADVLTALVRALWRSLRAELGRHSGHADAEPGAVTFVQRFGGSLNLNVHLHVIVPDGVFVRTERGVRFAPWAKPTAEQIERVVHRTRKSILRWLGRKGYLDEQEPVSDEPPDGLDACRQTALHYGQLVGLPSPATSTPKDETRRFEPNRVSIHRYHARTEDGFDLDARVVIVQGDDLGRERLVRYCARPAIVIERLQKLPDGRYSYETKYARNGRTHRVMTGTELIARIAALVPKVPAHYDRFGTRPGDRDRNAARASLRRDGARGDVFQEGSRERTPLRGRRAPVGGGAVASTGLDGSRRARGRAGGGRPGGRGGHRGAAQTRPRDDSMQKS